MRPASWPAVLAAFLISATAAADEAPEPPVAVGAFVGGNYVSDDIELGNAFPPDQVPGSGFMFGIRAGLAVLELAPGTPVAPRLWLELEGKFTASRTGDNAAAGRDSHFAPILGWRAHARLDLWSERPAYPFVVFGGGGETVVSDSPFIDLDTDASLHYGIGGIYRLTPALGLRADLRHLLTAGRENLVAQEVELHFGIEYRLSTAPAPAPAPLPPPEAPPPGPIDSDGDGIPDHLDACPNEPENFNGFEDDDGCPETDLDGDGLVGSQDACPTEPEDFDGFQDQDGCPDLDNDGDGIPDHVDACPDEPETFNGFEDEDGCPDEVPEEVKQFTGVIPGISFESGSARIRASSFATLDGAVAIFEKYPATRIRVSGHTDDVGSDEDNQKLSEERAAAVADYFVGKGIARDRIETVGHGESKPIADNDSRAGRATNRRIELQLIQGDAATPPAPPADAPVEPATEGAAP
jgi:OmpA-OmpF porin, OOP family